MLLSPAKSSIIAVAVPSLEHEHDHEHERLKAERISRVTRVVLIGTEEINRICCRSLTEHDHEWTSALRLSAHPILIEA